MSRFYLRLQQGIHCYSDIGHQTMERFGALSPTSFKAPRGGVRKKYSGYEYMLDNVGSRGERYYRCVNYKFGCKGRLKRTAKGDVVSKEHTCRKGSKPQKAAGPSPRPATNAIRGAAGIRTTTAQSQLVRTAPRSQPGNTAVQNPPPHPKPSPFPVQEVVRHQPLPGPAHAPSDNDDDDDNEEFNEIGNDDSQQLLPLQMQYLTQKMEIGELMKRKLEQGLRHDAQIKRKLEQEEEIRSLKKRKLELEILTLEKSLGTSPRTPAVAAVVTTTSALASTTARPSSYTVNLSSANRRPIGAPVTQASLKTSPRPNSDDSFMS